MANRNVDGEIIVGIDVPASTEVIKSDLNGILEKIKDLEVRIDHAKLNGDATGELQKQLDALKLSINVDVSGLKLNQENINKAGQQAGRGISESIQNGINNTRINTDKLNADIKTLKNNLNNFASKNAGFDTFKTEINGVDISLSSLIGKLSSVNNAADFSTVRSQANALRTAFVQLAQANKIQLQLDTGGYESKVESLISRTKQWTDGNGNARISTDQLRQSLEKLNAASAEYANNKTAENHKKLIQADKELDKQIKTVTNSIRTMNAELAKDSTISSLNAKIQSFYDKNTAAHGRWGAQLKQMLSETASGAKLTNQRVREIEQAFNGVTSAATKAGKVGKSWFQTLKESTKIFSAWTSPTVMIMKGVSEVKQAVSEIKELDNILTEISKTSGKTRAELEEVGISAYDSASKYGKTASDYLTGVQEMARSGFYGDKGTDMAEQSLLAQAAGDMTAELANNYVLAMNAAYKFNGEAEKINAVIDGQNMVCNRSSVALADMAAGMSKAGTVASSYNVSVEDLTAMIGTMEAVTKSGGDVIGNSLKSILMNLQNVTSDKIITTLNKANASMTEFVDGAEKLRNPIDIIRDLAKTFNELDDDDPLRSEILTNVAGKYQAAKFAALLQNMDMFDKMLTDYSEGAGSAMVESDKSANNLSGTLNKLSNSWTELVNTFVNADGLINVVNVLNNVLQSVTNIVDKLGSLGTIGLGAGLFAGIKNIGLFKSVQATDENGVENTRIVTSLQARRLAQEELNASLARQAAQLEIDTAALQTYEAECAKGTVSTERFAAIMQGASTEAQAYAVETKGAAGSTQAFTARQEQAQAELRATATASKAGTAALNGLKIALNMIAFAAIAKSISFVVEKFHEFTNATEIAEEKAKSFANSVNSSMENIAGNRSILKGLNDEYKQLSKGVSELGINTKLSSEQYDRYKEIMSQVSDIMPNLTARFNSQGEAIAFTKGKLTDLIDEYENYVQKDAAKYMTEGDSDGKTAQDVLDSFYKNGKMGFGENLANGIKNMFGSYDIGDLPVDTMLATFKEMQGKTQDEIAKFLNDVELGANGEYLQTENNRAKAIAQSVLGTTVTAIKEMDEEAFNQLQTDIISNIQSLQNNIDTDMNAVTSVLLESMNSKETFWALGEEQRDNVSTMLSSITADAWDSIWDGKEANVTDLNAFVERIIAAISSNKDGFADAWKSLFSMDEDIPVDEYIEKVKTFMDTICDVLNIDGEDNRIEWMVSLGFDIKADEAELEGLKIKLSGLNGGAKNQDAVKWVDTLTKEELKFAQSDEFINALEKQKKLLGNASLQAYDYENALNKVKNAQKYDKDTEITDISAVVSKLDENAIKDYNDKISTLKSYLDKLKSGDFTSADQSSLTDEFGITGNSVEELTKKIQKLMDTEMDSIIQQIDDILNTEKISEETKRQVESLKQSLMDTNKEAQGLNESLSLKTGNALADVQKLSQGLEQLDKIYADILDKEDFDWSSILNNADFQNTFGAFTEEYENFINTISKSPNDISACQSAFNNLVSAYIKGTGVLTELTEAEKQQAVNMLEQMGISNAAAIVEQALIENEKMLEAQKYATAQGCEDLTKATYEEIAALIKEGETTEEVRKYLYMLAIEKLNVSETNLNTKADCDNLLELAVHAGASAGQIRDLKSAMSELNTFEKSFDPTNPLGSAMSFAVGKGLENAAKNNPEIQKTELYKTYAKNNGLAAKETIQDTMDEIRKGLQKELGISDFKVNYSGGTTTRDTQEKLQKEAEKAAKDAEKAKEKAEETVEYIDGIEIKLNNLTEAASKATEQIDEMMTVGEKRKQTKKAIEATTKAIEAEYKAMKKYAEYAEKFSADAAKETTETVTETVANAAGSSIANMASSTAGVVNDAMQYVDKLRYVWGGASLTDGADCSGFVMQLYKKYGINLPHNSQAQFNNSQGTKIYNQQDLQPGDLVFFGSSASSIHHVGIYAGDGKFIEEKGDRWGTKLSPLAGRDYYAGKRFSNISSSASASAPSTDTTSYTTKTYTKVVPGIDSKTLAHYQKLVREGSFDIETITNEKLKNAIQSYQEWYDKMKSCRDKIDELNNDLKELYGTMAQIPVDKRDENVETLDTRIDIINSKRDNLSAVIVNKGKYNSTQKSLKQARSSIKKNIRTKAQKAASGLTKTELNEMNRLMKSGKSIPAKILDKITDSKLYEQCKTYNDTVYEHSQYAKTAASAANSTRKYNNLSNQLFDAEKAKTKQYKTAYNSISNTYGKSLDKVTSKGSKVKKAFGKKKYGLSDANMRRLDSCIKNRKAIPTDIMTELESISIFQSCLSYNEAVFENGKFKEQLDAARFDLQKQQQSETATRLEIKTGKHQNIADRASAKIDLNEIRAENAETPKKRTNI